MPRALSNQSGRSSLDVGHEDVFTDGSAAVGIDHSPKYVPATFTSGQQNLAVTGTFEGIHVSLYMSLNSVVEKARTS